MNRAEEFKFQSN